MSIDLLLVNPGEMSRTYQDLESEFTAIEPPLWCRLIAGYCQDRGHSVEILDAAALNLSLEQIIMHVESADPRLVCIVAYGHQPSASTQSMPAVIAICGALRLECDVPIIVVGGHVAALPAQTLEETSAHFVCYGEGPMTVAALLDKDTDKAAVPDLVMLNNHAEPVRRTHPAALIEDMTELHGAAWSLLPMDRYRAHNWQCFGDLDSRQPYASIYTSLGCPYRCSFCCINAPFHTNRYRMRDPRDVVSEIDMLYRRYGVRTIKIIDEMFVLNPRHVRAICEGLAMKPYADELNIWAYARIDTVREDQLALMRSAGIRWLALGIESGSALVRDGADKSFDESDIRAIVRRIQMAGINVIGNFIFGLPDDTAESMRATLDLAKDLNCEFANLYAAMAYPGSPLYLRAIEEGLALPENWSGYSQHSFDTHPLPTATLSSADVLRFRDDAFREYFQNPRYLEMIDRKFGSETVFHIQKMVNHRLPRALLEKEAAE